jgi:uncharacterized protein (DUF305 family)
MAAMDSPRSGGRAPDAEPPVPDPGARRAAGAREPGDGVVGTDAEVEERATGATDPAEAADPAEATDGSGGGDEGEEAEGDGGSDGLSWAQVAALGAALAFLGFAIGFFVTRDRPPSADSADVGFLQDMLTHHDQALGVATLTIANGEDPIVRSYAREVLTFQSYEIGVMTQMLAEWGFSRDERSDEAMAWMDMAVPVEQMPGLLTDEQLAEIGDARGAELDRLFLLRMAEHHRGGLHMAQEAVERADDDGVAALAARIARNQAGEINEYRLTAEELGMDIDIPPADVPPELPASGDD